MIIYTAQIYRCLKRTEECMKCFSVFFSFFHFIFPIFKIKGQSSCQIKALTSPSCTGVDFFCFLHGFLKLISCTQQRLKLKDELHMCERSLNSIYRLHSWKSKCSEEAEVSIPQSTFQTPYQAIMEMKFTSSD
jgi:hypothetical protein